MILESIWGKAMYKDIKACVVGSINMDLILNMPRVPETGENVLGTSYSYSCGGKGANQATALAKLGAIVKMIGKVADDENGNSLLENLKNNNIDVSSVAKDGARTGLAAIIIDGDGNNRIAVYEGANAEIDPEKAMDAIDSDTKLLLVQFETNEDVVISSINKAIKNNIITVVDCGPAKNFCLEKMQGVTILSPNESETKALTGILPDSEENILEASKILKKRSNAKFIVLKLGSKGCSLWDGNELKLFPAFKTDVVDTTAAGDCFTAALALNFIKTGDISASCVVGNKAGAIAVSRMGAQSSMPTIEEIAGVK